jgi:hypothetical protein
VGIVSDRFGVSTPDEMGLELRLHCKKNGITISQFLREAIEMRLNKQDDLKTMIQDTIKNSLKITHLSAPPVYRKTVTTTEEFTPSPAPAMQGYNPMCAEQNAWVSENIDILRGFKGELKAKMDERRRIIEEEEALANEVIVDG